MDRTGLVISEGAVFLMLESRQHADRRSARRYGRISGYGIASDAFHIGSPDTQAAALRAALDDAGLEATQIDYYNAHATATRGGDPVEAAAVRQTFAEHASRMPVSSTKAIHGHLLGAASAMELAVCTLAVRGGFLPATAHLVEADPECELNHVRQQPIFDRQVANAMSLSAGFGGTNVALIVSKEHDSLTKSPTPVEKTS